MYWRAVPPLTVARLRAEVQALRKIIERFIKGKIER
jgi:hypothetical protein